jgi:hypothetical protein
MWSWPWIVLSIYQKDLVMLNSGLGQRLKRPRSIWMGVRLMVTL